MNRGRPRKLSLKKVGRPLKRRPVYLNDEGDEKYQKLLIKMRCRRQSEKGKRMNSGKWKRG
jgi:hypothetical protein